MKQLTLLLITFFCLQFSSAQIHEIGLHLGGSNFIGDVGATDYIAPDELVIGGVYKWNRSERHSYRISLMYTELSAFDKDSDDPSRQARGLSFNNSILELSTGIEFTFVDFNLHKEGRQATPYLFTGVSVAQHDNFSYNSLGEVESEDGSSLAWGIPMVIGYKSLIGSNFVLSFEIGARYTFSDNLDGSYPFPDNVSSNRNFGNINNNDWYTFTGVTLTYTFGKNPCYCIF